MKDQLVGMMIGIPNAHDTRYCSDLVIPSSRRFISSTEFLFDNRQTVRWLDYYGLSIHQACFTVSFFAAQMIVSILPACRDPSQDKDFRNAANGT